MKSEETNNSGRLSELFRSMFEQSPQSIQVFTPDGRTLRVNRAWEELWGVTLDQIGDYNVLKDPQLIAKGIMPYIERGFAGEVVAIPAILYDPNETIPGITKHRDPGRWVRAFIHPVRDAEGRISEIVVMHEDITDRKVAEEQLQQQQKEYQSILDSVPALVWYKDKNNRHVRCNSRAAEFMGLSKQEVEGASAWDLFPHEQAERFYMEDLEVLSSGEPKLGIIEHLKMPSGETLWHQTDKLPYYNHEGSVAGVIIFSLDITERRRAEEEKAKLVAQVEDEHQRFGCIIASVPGVVWEAWGNPDAASQRIDFVSDYVETMLGYSVQEWVQTPNFWLTIVHPEDRERAAQVVTEQFNSGRGGVNEFRWVAKDGRVVWVEARASVMTDDEGRPLGMRGVTMNVSARKRAEAERERLLAREQQLRSAAESANQLKDEFLATLSHELRTPLSAILGWGMMLQQNELEVEQRARAADTIVRNARAQAQLIEDLLDVSRIITGKLRLDVQPFELAPAIEAAVEGVRPAADAKGIYLQVLLDPRAGLISGDPARMQQVAWNLLSNAVKYTPKGGRVQVRLERVNSHVELTVSDTGQGISPEFLPHVFDRFRQADQATTRRHGGLGLGLAIVRHLVEMHGASVHAESAGEGKGSTFRVKLPLMILHGPPRSPEEGEENKRHPTTGEDVYDGAIICSARLDGLHIIVVDDEEDAREMVALMLSRCGADVLTAASAGEALKHFEARKPDVLVSDIGMPGEDGYALIRKVRGLSADKGGRTLALALTAYARTEDRVRALSAGYQVHVAKPVDSTELIAAVASLAGRITF